MNIAKFHKFLLELYIKRKARGEIEYAEYAELCNKKLPHSEKEPTLYYLPWDMTLEECLFIARMHFREHEVQRYIERFPNCSYTEALQEYDLI